MIEKSQSVDGETPFDLSHLRDRSITTHKELDRAEAENIRKATLKYLSIKPSRRTSPFTYRWLLKLHKEMFGEVWKLAGIPRRENLNIGVDWQWVQTELENLLLDMEHWQSTPDSIIEDAAMIHYRGVHIHPFHGGNGRWSRFLADVWLKQHNQPIIDWPAEMNVSKSPIRAEYLDAVKSADRHEFGPLYALHRTLWSGPTT